MGLYMGDENQDFTTTTETVAQRTATVHWHAPLMRLFPSDNDRQGVVKLIEEAMALFGRLDVRDFWTTIGDVEVQWQSEVDEKTDRITLHICLYREGPAEMVWGGTEDQLEEIIWFHETNDYEGAPPIPAQREYAEAFYKHLANLKSKK
jgi:hypothetical protein